jgi:hypothetical protein
VSLALSWLRNLLAGCGVESESMEALSILTSLIEAYSSGEATDADVESIAKDLCMGITALASRCGKTLDVGSCVSDVKKIVSASISLSGLRERIRKRLASKRSAASGTSLI